MSTNHTTLHGSAPDTCSVALLLIDVINDLEFPGGDLLLAHALPLADRLAALKQRARRAGIPTIYINDNFGRWRSDFASLVQHCLADGIRGEPLAVRLRPSLDDYFVLKPKHSGFFSTTLDLLLEHLQARSVIVTGLTTDSCVLFTAADAYMRGYRVLVPHDCVAAEQTAANTAALAHMARVLKADTRPAAELDLDALVRLEA